MDKAEKQEAIAADPYPRFRADLIARGIADEAALAKIEEDVEAAIDDAVEFALAAPFPDIAELRQDVFADPSIVPEESFA